MWSSFGASSPEARLAARRVLVDQVAVSVLASRTVPGGTVAEPLATRWSDGEALHAAAAVLANRVAADDSELTAGPELGAAALAAAEVADATFGDLLEAVTVACEIESALRAWLQEGVERAGLHPPALFAAASAATASARLLRLDEEAAWSALTTALALTPRSPYASFAEGVTGKRLYGAWGQRLGLEAALWARRGITGARSLLDGSRGVARAFGVEGGAPGFRSPDSAPWAIEHVTHKRYGASRACHPTLVALESLESTPFDASEIARVEIETYPFAVDLDERVRAAGGPSSSIAAQMSVRHAAALWLVTGELAWERFDAREVRSLAERIVLRSNGAADAPGTRSRTSSVRVLLEDGTGRAARGEGTWHPTEEELVTRFESRRLSSLLWHASDDEPVRRLMEASFRG